MRASDVLKGHAVAFHQVGGILPADKGGGAMAAFSSYVGGILPTDVGTIVKQD